MCHLQHAGVVEVSEIRLIGPGILASVHRRDDAVLYGQADRLVRNSAKGRRDAAVEDDRPLNAAEARHHVDLSRQHVDRREGGVAAVAAYIVHRVDLKPDIRSGRCRDVHGFCVPGELRHPAHKHLQLRGVHTANRTDQQILVEVHEAHVAQFFVSRRCPFIRRGVQKPLVVELDPHIRGRECGAEHLHREVRVRGLAHASRCRALDDHGVRSCVLCRVGNRSRDGHVAVIVRGDRDGLPGLHGEDLFDQFLRCRFQFCHGSLLSRTACSRSRTRSFLGRRPPDRARWSILRARAGR